MNKKGPAWTPAQEKAIDTRSCDVIVTASAGTGKTAVLTKRCVNILSDTAEQVDVDEILVLTFTEAAAEEMTARIYQQLRKEFAGSGQPHLRKQLLTLEAANISTIHSFCKRLITEHFYLLDLDPAFRIADSDEADLLKAEVLSEVLEHAWQDQQLAPRLEQLFAGRNVESERFGFLRNIINISEFLESHPEPEKWFARCTALSHADPEQTARLIDRQKRQVLSELNDAMDRIAYGCELDRLLLGEIWAGKISDQLLTKLARAVGLIEKGNFNQAAETIAGFAFAFRGKPKDIVDEDFELVKTVVNNARYDVRDLLNRALFNPLSGAAAQTDRRQLGVMIELLKRFDDAYRAAKRKAGALDFSDLQRYALRLLREHAHLAEALRTRFKYVFVDEFQDVNDLQQGIIDMVAQPGRCFLVGDVKQCIYAFRQANPENFVMQIDRSSELDRTLVELSTNFRSRAEILDFANTVFHRIMTQPLSPVDYQQQSFLQPGFDYKPLAKGPASDSRGPVELYILDEDSPEDTDDEHDENGDENNDVQTGAQPSTSRKYSPQQRQALFIADKIRQMVCEQRFDIYDKQSEKYRPVEYRDIVVLMRSLANRVNEYVEIFQMAGIPVNAGAAAGYFAATEIMDIVSLLKVLDNPRRDIEFAAVLRSPLFSITDSQLAEVRTTGPGSGERKEPGEFYALTEAYAENGPDKHLRQRLSEVIENIQQWRSMARRLPLAEVIWDIYRRTDYLSFMTGLPGGPQRRSNLLKLHERAIQFEQFTTTGFGGSLTRFVSFIERLVEKGQDWAPAEPDSSAENAVRIMSVHKSKGLEFPVVFLARLDTRFNMRQCSGDCLVDDEFLGLKIYDPEKNVRLRSMAHEVISADKKTEALSEEMRILYVAMTRAREKLILTASKSVEKCARIVQTVTAAGAGAPQAWQVSSARTLFEWLVYALASCSRFQNALGIAPEKSNTTDPTGSAPETAFDVSVISQDLIDRLCDKYDRSAGQQTPPANQAKSLLEKLSPGSVIESLKWQYDYDPQTRTPAKSSVSQLTHKDDEFAKINRSEVFKRSPRITEKSMPLSPAALGSAAHLVMETIDFTAPVDEQKVRDHLQKLCDQGLALPAAARMVRPEWITGFFEHEKTRHLLADALEIFREWEFTFCPADRGPDSEIVQGIIDMLVVNKETLAVVDFKTDNVNRDSARDRAELYRDQLLLYAQAAEMILHKKAAARLLYFMRPGLWVQID